MAGSLRRSVGTGRTGGTASVMLAQTLDPRSTVPRTHDQRRPLVADFLFHVPYLAHPSCRCRVSRYHAFGHGLSHNLHMYHCTSYYTVRMSSLHGSAETEQDRRGGPGPRLALA